MRRPGTFRTSATAGPFRCRSIGDMCCGRIVLNTRGDHTDPDAHPFLGLPLSCCGGDPIPWPVETTGLIPQFCTAGHQKTGAVYPNR